MCHEVTRSSSHQGAASALSLSRPGSDKRSSYVPACREHCLLYRAWQVLSSGLHQSPPPHLKQLELQLEIRLIGAAETEDNSVWVCHRQIHLSHIWSTVVMQISISAASHSPWRTSSVWCSHLSFLLLPRGSCYMEHITLAFFMCFVANYRLRSSSRQDVCGRG